jgi:phospholipid:diacylglycerol acyltransferase
MATLRRRIFGSSGDSPPTSRESSPALTPGGDGGDGEELRVIPAKELKKLTKPGRKTGTKRRNAWIFGLGGVFGIVVAALFAGNNEILDLRAIAEANLESFLDVLPAGLVKDAQDLQVSAT